MEVGRVTVVTEILDVVTAAILGVSLYLPRLVFRSFRGPVTGARLSILRQQ